MYVCVCNAYRDAEISEVAHTGIRCARRAFSVLGNGPQCGRCLPMAQALIDQVHKEREASAPTGLSPAADRGL